MIEDVNKYLVGIVIGIRFGPNFSITDDFGNIADRILYKKNPYFDENMFPLVGVNPLEIKLEDEKSGDSFLINSRDIILTCNLDNKGLTFDSNLTPKFKLDDLSEINTRFKLDIVDGVLKDYKFNRIRRIGYISKYFIKVKGLAQRIASQTIGDTIGGITEIELRFSKKYPTPEAMIKKDVNDYHNVIFYVNKKADKDEIYISLDYQAYYDPTLESIKDVDFSEFLASMKKYNSETFPKWLNEKFGK